MKSISKILIVFSLFITAFVISSLGSFAYELQEINVMDTDSFELGPTQFEITAEKGSVFTKQLELTNRSGEEIQYVIYVRDFKGSSNLNNFMTILEDEDYEDLDYGASDWFELEIDEVFLEHGERLVFDVNINVPSYADAGEHYAIVLVEEKDPRLNQLGSTMVKTKSRVGSLFLIDVEGRRTKSSLLESFSSDKNFYETTPINFNIDISNTGSVHVNPSGKIDVKNIFGKVVDELEVKEFLVLRDSKSRQTVTWDNMWAFGKYTAELSISLDRGEGLVIEDIEIWVIPWKFLLIIFFIFIIIFFVLRFLLSKVKIEVKLK